MLTNWGDDDEEDYGYDDDDDEEEEDNIEDAMSLTIPPHPWGAHTVHW